MHSTAITGELLFENPAQTARIFRHEEKQCLEMGLYGTLTEEEYKEGFSQFAKLLERYQYSQAIFNNLQLESDTLTQRAWFLTKFLPMAYRCVVALKYKAAVVAPRNPIQKMATQMVARSAKAMGKPIEVAFFTKHDEALRWM